MNRKISTDSGLLDRLLSLDDIGFKKICDLRLSHDREENVAADTLLQDDDFVLAHEDTGNFEYDEDFEEYCRDNGISMNSFDAMQDAMRIESPVVQYSVAENGEVLAHYGTPRHSGRYPWGSGKDPQRHRNFVQRVKELSDQGMSQVEIAKALGMSTGDLRATTKNYKYQIEVENRAEAQRLRDKGWSNVAIGKKLDVSEGTVRNYLDPRKKARENRVANVANALEDILKEKPYLDVGAGVERQLGISTEQMNAALLMLQDKGYNVQSYDLPQVSNPKQKTKLKVLCGPDVTREEFKENLGKVTSPDGLYFEDHGEIVRKTEPIPSIDSKRILVRYATKDGTINDGSVKDGVIELRPGVEDLSLNGRRYAQVRIAVDGTHYLKGMAVYATSKTQMPDGVDVVFNTSKPVGMTMLGKGDDTVLKEMKKDQTTKQIDMSNPFGSAFRQEYYVGKDGKEHISPINIVNDDEDWDRWKKNLSAQFLSKQPLQVAKGQLDLRKAEYIDEFNTIRNLTNPTLKKQLLEEFADECDSAAVHLKAAAMPRQGSYAILPVNSLKNNEVYAPGYNTGEEVILVRHPHEGVFQIPRLIVNNNNREGKEMIGPLSVHAIGITAKTAEQLSGADYDGDTVLVIPTKGHDLHTEKPLKDLIGYNPSDHYSREPDDPICTGKSRYDSDGKLEKRGDGFNKGRMMGEASNLITDMTLRGANFDEVARAVRFSMCVIDAEKHNLDWKRCYYDNDIGELKENYQKHINAKGNISYGASTLISAARGETDIDDRREVYSKAEMNEKEKKLWEEKGIPPSHKMTPEERVRWENGEIIYRETGATKKERRKITDTSKMTREELDRFAEGQDIYRDTGKIVKKTQKIDRMAAVKDAYELSSGTQMEGVYADYANAMKALANEARKEMRATGNLTQNPSAKIAYADVVGKGGTLEQKILTAEKEAPKERQAQILANSIMRAKLQANPELKSKENQDKRKKLASKALDQARDMVNGGKHTKRYQIELTDREWEAIQAGAISEKMFKTVLRYSDTAKIKQRAMPREKRGLAPTAKSRARMMLQNGYTQADVAEALGISVTTLRKEFNNFEGMNLGGDK